MGILNFVKSQFIEIIEWVDDTQNTIVYRFPVQNKEIKMGAKLTVRETQAAVFFNEGRIADVFDSGLYALSTQNLPVLTKLQSWPYGFNSPFKAEVYFVNTKQFTEQKWGTENPIMLRDAEFGMLRLRAFGIYSFRVGDPVKFLQEISGTNGLFDTQNITGQLKRVIISGLTDLLGELKISALDLASNYDEISEKALEKMSPKFMDLGLSLVSFYVENISLPQEVEQILDKRTEMGLLGNIQQYAQFQAADSIKDAAQNPGGLAGTGIGLGVGAAIGSTFSQTFAAQQTQQTSHEVQVTKCSQCGAQMAVGVKFCPECGKSTEPLKAKCVKCGALIQNGTKFCSECGTPQVITCENCGKELKADSKFCPECGTKVE